MASRPTSCLALAAEPDVVHRRVHHEGMLAASSDIASSLQSGPHLLTPEEKSDGSDRTQQRGKQLYKF
jgi:hypothetical protein